MQFYWGLGAAECSSGVIYIRMLFRLVTSCHLSTTKFFFFFFFLRRRISSLSHERSKIQKDSFPTYAEDYKSFLGIVLAVNRYCLKKKIRENHQRIDDCPSLFMTSVDLRLTLVSFLRKLS